MKTCTKCGEEKPLTDYSRDKSKRDGLRAQCKACRKAYDAAYVRKNAARISAKNAEYYAERKEVLLAQMAVYRAENAEQIKERKAARYVRDREQILASQAAWRAANPERVKEIKAKDYAANRDRYLAQHARYRRENAEQINARRRAVPHPQWESRYRRRMREFGYEPVVETFTRDELIDRHGDACVHCGGPFEHLDHYPVPVALGGAHSLDNCVPSCEACNVRASRSIGDARGSRLATDGAR